MDAIRSKLQDLIDCLATASNRFELRMARQIGLLLKNTDEDIIEFINSDELWGGSGSVADQAMMEAPLIERRQFWSAMIRLGELQIDAGYVNVRTPMWVGFFRELLADSDSPV